MHKINKLIIFLLLLLLPFKVFAKENNKITLYFFHGDGCPHCAEEEIFLESIEDDYSNLKIVRYEVWYDTENAELLDKVHASFKITNGGVPTTLIGERIHVGYSNSIGKEIKDSIEYYNKNEYKDVLPLIKKGNYTYEAPDSPDEKEDDITIDIPLIGTINVKDFSLGLAAIVIGLVDGFNPCAMWILLFLISVLIGMKNRKRMWALGLTFLITSALVYMLIMLSWITIAVKITTMIWIRNTIALIALIGGIYNLYNYIKTRKDSGCTVVKEDKRKKIFKQIRKFTSEKSFILAILGIMLLAISVNVVELACSAGLPLVFSELLAINKVSSFMKFAYTLIYIFFFLIDDLIVFFVAMFTMKITGFSTKYNNISHLIGGIIMVIIGILLLFKPGWLMFNFK